MPKETYVYRGLTESYKSDMRIIDESLTTLENKVDRILNILIRLETILLGGEDDNHSDM